MAFSLKPADLENAKKAEDVQKKTKADLKSAAGKAGVKFIAAKNCVIGGKTVNLFIVTDNPTAFETVLKAKHPKAYRAKGTCDVVKVKSTFQVAIKSAAGQMTAETVTQLVKAAVVSDKSIVAINARGPVGPETGGVAGWAQKQYRKEAKRTLVASVTPDGKIGSVYFGDEGRIRTTHSAGPSKESHDNYETVQFNIDEEAAVEEFKKAKPKLYESKKMWDYFDQWVAEELKDVSVSSAPSWAKKVTGPKTAHDIKKAPLSENIKLFEIFKNINGDVEGWHPSRGTATKFETDKQTISILEAAIKHIDGKGLKDPGERNRAFYDFVKTRLPKFVPLMRDPDEV